jgi:hypothetical protein
MNTSGEANPIMGHSIVVALIYGSRLVIFTLSSGCVRYDNKRNKWPSTQLITVISLIWQHVSTSEGHLQASSKKYIKGIVYNFIKF